MPAPSKNSTTVQKFFCVWTGPMYGLEYVTKLRNMIGRHFKGPSNFRLYCLTDHFVKDKINGITFIDISHQGLRGWWAKMLLLDPEMRGPGRCIYFDLDTIVCGTLSPLLKVPVNGLGVCANFTRRARKDPTGYPCKYGSCVMVYEDGWGKKEFDQFMVKPAHYMAVAAHFGDQKVLERLYPDATLLQDVLPDGYFIGRRDFHKYTAAPREASVLVFAGPDKPHTTPHPWLKELWV